MGGELACSSCGWSRTIPEARLQDDRPNQCLICGNPDLWRQKDFPQGLGLLLVALGALGSSIAWYFYMPRLALGILMGFALADLLLFALMPDVLVCYRCQARHSGIDTTGHNGFNHETAERYRQEKLRLADSCKAAGS